MRIITAFLAFVWCTSAVAAAGPGVGAGNGGDAVKLEFSALATSLVDHLDQIPSLKLNRVDLDRMRYLLKNASIQIKDRLELNGVEVDAINFPDLSVIEVSRSRWMLGSSMAPKQKTALIIHEVLGLMRMDDSRYQISGQALRELGSLVDLRMPPPKHVHCEFYTQTRADDFSAIGIWIDFGEPAAGSLQLKGENEVSSPIGRIRVGATGNLETSTSWLSSLKLEFVLLDPQGKCAWRGGNEVFDNTELPYSLRYRASFDQDFANGSFTQRLVCAVLTDDQTGRH